MNKEVIFYHLKNHHKLTKPEIRALAARCKTAKQLDKAISSHPKMDSKACGIWRENGFLESVLDNSRSWRSLFL